MKQREIYNLYTTNKENPNDPDGIRRYFQRIIENMPNNVYWLNRDCITMGCNKNTLKLLGLDRLDQFVGMTYEKMGKLANWKESQAQSFKNDDMEVMESGLPKINVEEPPLYDDNGDPVYYLSSRVPIFDDNNSVIGVVGISVDITEKKKAEHDLIKERQNAEVANFAKTEFIENMSHDIRTPITGILGVTQMLLNQAQDAHAALRNKQFDELADALNDIKENSSLVIGATNELLNLSNEILEVMRLESGNLEKKVEVFDVRKIVTQVFYLLTPVSRNKNIQFSKEVSNDVPDLLIGYPTYFQRTLINLVSNALKFTKEGFVKINLKRDGEENQSGNITLVLSVKDSGIGIPEDKFDIIFEHFSRLTPSYEGVYKGSGLGLYTVKRYLDAMHGEISVNSKVGEGSQFTITIPFQQADKKTSYSELYVLSSIKNESSEKSYTKTTSVLLVEDNHMAMLASKALLKEINCSIDCAETGDQAVYLANKNKYDLILMDIGLPDFDGIEATKKIRSLGNKERANVPIVALTAHASNSDRCKEALAAGIQDVLGKPAQIRALVSIFQRFVLNNDDRSDSLSTGNSDSDTKGVVELQPIDWHACVKKCMGRKKLAYEMLIIFFNEIPDNKSKLEKYFSTGDFDSLRAELHRIRGGVSYLELPLLDSKLRIFHEAIKSSKSTTKDLEKAFSEVENALDAFYYQWMSEKFD